MTNEVTTLSLAVDTTDVKTASQTLNEMATAGNSAAASTTRLEKAHAAMVAELKRIGSGVSELVRLASAQNAAAGAAQNMAKASATAALASTKAAASIRQNTQAISAGADASAKSLGNLSLAARSIDTSGLSNVNAQLSAAATQAARTATAISNVGAASKAPVTHGNSSAVTIKAPVINGAKNNAFAEQADSATVAVNKLTAAARSQASALNALAPSAAAVASSYNSLASNHIRVEPPAGLSAATAALKQASDQAQRAQVILNNIAPATVNNTVRQARESATQPVRATTQTKQSASIEDTAVTARTRARVQRSQVAAAALREEAKAIEKLSPAASGSAATVQKLSLSFSGINSSAIKEITRELSAASSQASRTAQAIGNIKVKPIAVTFDLPSKPIVQTVQVVQKVVKAPVSNAGVASSAAVATSGAVSNTAAISAIRNEVSAIEKIIPAANASAGAILKLSASASQISTNSVNGLTRELIKAENQANRTAQAVNSIGSQPSASTSQKGTRSSNAEANRATRDAEREASRVAREAASAQRAADKQAATAAAEARANERLQARSNRDASAAKVRDAAKATRELADANRHQAKEAANAAFKNQQLGFQIHDFAVQVVSGQNPLTAFIQQGSQLSGTFGGASNAFRAVIGLFTPLRVAAGLATGAIAAVGYAFYEGSKQSKAFADALVLTGGFAGQTEDKFNSLAKSIAKAGQVSVSASREAAQAVLASGQFGPQVFNQATEATALFAEATGQTADEVIKDFSRMSHGVAKWAADTNRSMHFLTAAQYELIKSLEDQGREVEAQSVVFDALNNRLKQLDPNLGTIERTLRSVKNGWKSFWDAAYDIGRTETIGDKLNKVNQQIEDADRTKEFTNKVLGRPAGTGSGASQALVQQRSQLTREQFRESEQADSKAVDAELQQRRISARDRLREDLLKADPKRAAKKELDRVNRDIRDSEGEGFNLSDADKSLLRAKATQGKSRGAGGGEANQVLRAQLDQDIKFIQDMLNNERDAFAFNERFLQGQYQAGQKSLKDYYDARRDASTQGIQAEIAAIELENQKLAEFRAKSKDPSEKIQAQTRIDENTAQISRLRAQGIRELELLNQEAASSFKQLDESVENYNATLEQLLGNEEKAAQIRAAIAIQNARVLSSQKGGDVIDIKAYERALNIQNQFNEVQRRSGALAAAGRTAEEAFAEAAESRGLSLRDTETGIYKIRQEQLHQLADLVTKAQELAEASTNPAVKQFAADLAVEYAKAAKAVDPALQKLKDANRDLAQTIANTLTNLPQTFTDAFSRRRQEASDDIRSEKDEYNRRIDQLEQYLAESSDKNDKARLREKIKALQDEKGGLKKESRASSFFKTIGETILAPIGQQVLSTITKVAVSDPLQKMLENSLNNLTTGDGILGQIFKDAFGVKTDPKDIAKSQEVAAITATTTALQALEAAANAAAGALPNGSGIPSVNGAAGSVAPELFNPVQDDINGVLGDFGASVQDAEAGNKDFAKTVPTVTNVLSKLVGATSDATGALSILPSIISLISAAGASSSASSAGSGLIGLFGSMFGGGASGAATTGAASGTFTNVLFHNGGIAGQGTQRRTGGVASMFDNATRYHTGGIAGLQPDEVPAILMGGPKGRREEILTAKDPRHRDNLLKPQNRPYMAGQHSSANSNTVNNKSQQINMALNFHTGGATVDRRTAKMAGAEVYQQMVNFNKRYK